MTQERNESTGTLVGEALTHVSSLVRKEVDLARAEIGENLNRAAVAIGMIAGALIVALAALNVLTAAIVVALTEAGIDPGWAAFIVGVVLAIIAWAMVAKGASDLKLTSLAPTRTAENLKRDARAVKGTQDVH